MAVYLVEGPNGTKRLIETRTAAGAINHVASGDYKATSLNTSELVKHIKAGLLPETIAAKEEDEAKTADLPLKADEVKTAPTNPSKLTLSAPATTQKAAAK